MCKTGSGHHVIPVCRVLLCFSAKMQMRAARRRRGPSGEPTWLGVCALQGEPGLPRQGGSPAVLGHAAAALPAVARAQLHKAGTEAMSGRRYETCHAVIAVTSHQGLGLLLSFLPGCEGMCREGTVRVTSLPVLCQQPCTVGMRSRFSQLASFQSFGSAVGRNNFMTLP